MGNVNTNIRIDELETVVDDIAGAVNAMPAYYQMNDHEHNTTIEASEFAEIKAAIDAGKIILTGALTGKSMYTMAAHVPCVWTYASDDEIILQTFARANQPGSTTLYMQCPMIIDIKYVTSSMIKITLQDAGYYP